MAKRQGLLGTESDDDAFSEGYFAPHAFMEQQRELERQQEEERRRKAFFENLAAQIEGARKPIPVLPPDVASLMERRKREATGIEEEPMGSATEEITPETSRRAILGSAMRSQYLEPLKEFGLLTEKTSVPGQKTGHEKIDVYEYYKNLPPNEKEDFLQTMRGEQVFDLGDKFVRLGIDRQLHAFDKETGQEVPITGGTVAGKPSAPPPQEPGIPPPEGAVSGRKGLAPAETVAHKGAVAGAEETAKGAAKTGTPEYQQKVMSDLQSLRQTMETIDDLLAHPGMDAGLNIIGPAYSFGLLKEPIPKTAAAGFVSKFKQLQGRTLLESLKQMKEGGANVRIPEKALEAAQTALSGLDTHVKKEDFVKDAMKFRKSIENLYDQTKGLLLKPKLGEIRLNSYGQKIIYGANGWQLLR